LTDKGVILKIICSESTDILNIFFTENQIEESDEEKSGMILDYDEDCIVEVEILDVSKRMDNPFEANYQTME